MRELSSREVNEEGVARLLGQLVGPVLLQALPRLIGGQALLAGLGQLGWGHGRDMGVWDGQVGSGMGRGGAEHGF